MKNDLPPLCDFQISLMINCESTWPGLNLIAGLSLLPWVTVACQTSQDQERHTVMEYLCSSGQGRTAVADRLEVKLINQIKIYLEASVVRDQISD